MALPVDEHQEESRGTAAALGMAAPPAGTDHEAQQDVDHVIVTVATSDKAAVVVKFSQAAPPTSGERVAGAAGILPEIPVSRQGAAPEILLTVDPLEALIERERQRVEKQEAPRRGKEQPCIWKVHPSIREQESSAYEPKLVSIGPLHHDNDSLRPMEDIKFGYLSNLLRRSPNNKLGNYIKVIRDCEPLSRKQYAEEVKLGVDDFVKMLVLDGCFIIEYFLKRFFKETEDAAQLSGVRWGLSHLRRDLMLLENQIPFFVLVKLFQQSTIPSQGTHQDPPTLMGITFDFLEIGRMSKEIEQDPDGVLHLLHLHHKCLNPSEPDDSRSFEQSVCHPLKKTASLITVPFLALLYILLLRKLPCSSLGAATEESAGQVLIPCATELHQAGVKFRKKQRVSSYLQVSFTEGTLRIPFVVVQETTSSTLRNFIALEQCCPQVGNYFTSYAVFMDSIINTDSDVAVLRNRGIIESKLGSDKEVIKVFNTLCKGIHLNYADHYNASLFKAVKKYCEEDHHRWRAILKNTYFSSPWTAISLVAAIFAFGIVITQGYFNIFRRRK